MRLSKYLWLIMPWLVLSAAGQNTPPPASRSLSLEDCIQEALKNNIDIQIERYNPEIFRFTLDASYGYYDPVFTSEVSRQNITREPGGIPFSSTRTESVNSVRASPPAA